MALPVADGLTEVLRRGAGTLLQQAVEAEVAEIITRFQELKDERGRQRGGEQRPSARAAGADRDR